MGQQADNYVVDNAPSLTDKLLTVKSPGGGWALRTVLYETLRAMFAGVSNLNTQNGTNYTLALTDRGGTVEMTNASANTVQIPPDSVASFNVGDWIFVSRLGAGLTTVTAAAGVALNGAAQGSFEISGQYGWVRVYKRAANTWVAQGDNIAGSPATAITTRNGQPIEDMAALLAWHQTNSGPTTGLTPISGIQTIANQTDADNLAGTEVTGAVKVTASGLTLSNFKVIHDGTNDILIEMVGGVDNITVTDFECDGQNASDSTCFGGTSFSENILIERADIHSVFQVGIRAHALSTYRHVYMHDMLAWNSGTMGTYLPAGDPTIYPDTDGFLTLRSGNVIEECYLESPATENNTSLLWTKADITAAPITAWTVRRCYLDGAQYTVRIYDGAVETTSGVVLEDNLFGPNYGTGIFEYDVGAGDITFTNNVWSDDLTPVPTASGPVP